MRWLQAGMLSVLILLFVPAPRGALCAERGVTVSRFIGKEAPNRLYIGSNHIFYLSDTLTVNGRMLKRGTEYRFDSHLGYFDFSGLNLLERDTLVVSYRAVPSWLKSVYGRELPDVSGGTSVSRPELVQSESGLARCGGSDISISGAKSFRFSTRSEGTSNFDQSLDLIISGHVTPELAIRGAISDRGYNAAYGTANSRIHELDRVNLTLTSPRFSGQIGDIVLQPEHSLNGTGGKKVSGASAAVTYDRWHAHGVAARPKGRFQTVRFQGEDGRQGPYQITSGNRAAPIVPGSETVWLDGKQLDRGSVDDYTIDYPAGQITFTVNRPIDGRSRIEIDFEPLDSDYKGELFESGGGIVTRDSVLAISVGWLREGDDREQLQTGELTDLERNLLESVGDNTQDAVRSGVRVDSSGDYLLIVDSLPDSVYQYVGDGSGEFEVTYTFLGKGNGSYTFLGGNHYQYAGAGNGDYLPVVLVPAPERTDYYTANAILISDLLGRISAEIQQSSHDRNLFSTLDDGDNASSLYKLTADKYWGEGGHAHEVHVSTRYKQTQFRARSRLYGPDFARTYMLPVDLTDSSDEAYQSLAGTVSPARGLSISPDISFLSYKDRFDAARYGVDARYATGTRMEFCGGWSGVSTDYATDDEETEGSGDLIELAGTVPIADQIESRLDYQFDSRKNTYSGVLKGTRYNRVSADLSSQTESIGHELYIEDSLSDDWNQVLVRNRVSFNSTRSIGSLDYSGRITYQWLDRTESSEESFLGRLNIQYADTRQRLNLNSSYTVSEETRNSRGISYLEVDPGEGEYILEDGVYIPDPDGNYIRVDEVLSDVAEVRRGERSFDLSKTWAGVSFRVNSRIEEELLAGGQRPYWWVIPFLSDYGQPYLYFNRRYAGDLKVLPFRGGHAVTLAVEEHAEIRTIASERRTRQDVSGKLTLREPIGQAVLEETGEYFSHDRDSYYSASGNVTGFKTSLAFRRFFEQDELTIGGSYRRAKAEDGGRADTYSIFAGSRLQVIQKGEFRASAELYNQDVTASSGSTTYLLTDNRFGRRGAFWTVGLRYGLKKEMRINVSVSGRHSDDRTARITGRGEFVAGF